MNFSANQVLKDTKKWGFGKSHVLNPKETKSLIFTPKRYDEYPRSFTPVVPRDFQVLKVSVIFIPVLSRFHMAVGILFLVNPLLLFIDKIFVISGRQQLLR